MNHTTHCRARRGGLRSAALLGAMAVTFLMLAGVVWLAMRQAPTSDSSGAPPPPDITQIGPNQRTRQLGGSVRMQVRVVDKQDPTRAVGELIAARSTPLEGKRYALEEPQVWIYLDGGRRLWLSARRGQALFPDFAGSRPEDGIIEGDVLGRLFEARADGAEPDPHHDVPLLTLRTDVVRFDLRLGEVRIPGELTVEGDSVSFAGAQVLAVMNEASERIELLRIEQTHRLTIRPEARANRTPTSLASDTPPEAAAPAAQPKPTPIETLYTAIIQGDVNISQSGRSLSAAQLDVWLRLIDQALPPDAVAPLARITPPTPSPVWPSLLPSIAALHFASIEPVALSPADTTPPDSTIELRWSGPMELRPLDETPPQLARNHVYVHASSPDGTLVRLHDAPQKLTALGQSAQYGATRREGTLTGEPAHIEREGTGYASAGTFSFDLTEGVVTTAGGGTLAAHNGDSQRRVDWADSARLTILSDDTGAPRSISAAHLKGEVLATDGSGRIGGDELLARFEPSDPADASSPAYLHTLNVTGHARAADGNDGSLESESLLIGFTPRAGDAAGQSDPTRIEARGTVAAASGTDRLRAQRLIADISPPTDDTPATVQSAVAEGGVRFERADGVFATGDHLVAHPGPQTVRITGETASVGQGESAAFGSHIDLNGEARTLAISTPGRIEHLQPGADGQPPMRLYVSWTESMTFNDATGLGRCVGDVSALAVQGDLARDTLTGHLVELALERVADNEKPEPAPHAAHTENEPPLLLSGNRRLVWSRAEGADAQHPAKIELRRYASQIAPSPDQPPAADEARLERLLYLEGGQVLVDHLASAVEIPTAGKLLVLDRRASVAQPQQTSPRDPLPTTQTARGTALFTWAASARFDQSSGVAVLRENATMVHAPHDGGERIDLQCETLTAHMDQPAPQPSGAEPGGLRSAVAQGDVWLRMGQKELSSDLLTYDAARRRAEATGTAPGRVTAFDPANGAPITATRVIWDMAADRFQLIGLDQPIVSPR